VPRKPKRPDGNVRPRNGFTRRFKGGPAAHKEAVRRAQFEENRARQRREAWAMFVKHLTFQQIGDAMRPPVSNKTAYYLCRERLAELQREGIQDDALMFARAQQHLDEMRRALLPSLWHRSPNVRKNAADTLVAVSAREARLMGLDRTKAEGYSVEQVRGLLRGVQVALHEAVGAAEAALTEAQRALVESRFNAALRRFAGATVAEAKGQRPALAQAPEE
jgi:hypothetical protein